MVQLPAVTRDQPLATHDERRALADVIQSPLWKWVVHVYKTSGLSVDLLDEHFNLVATPGRDDSARLVAPTLKDAVSELAPALANGERKVASVAGQRFCGGPVAASGEVAGAVVVGGEAQTRESDLQSALSLLIRALEELLSEDDDRGSTAARLSALHDLMDDASATGSEQDVCRVFAEIVNVWDEVEVVGYRGDLAGRYVLAAALPGSDRENLPEAIDAESLPPDPVVSLTASMQQRLGFSDARYQLLVRLSAAGGPWLLAMSDRQSSQQFDDWFNFYIAALTASLNAALDAELARTTWTIMQHLVEHESPRDAIRHAILGVAETLGADVRLTMSERDGAVTLSIGEPLHASDSEGRRAADVLRARIDAPAGRHVLIEMRPTPGGRFTQRDVKVFEAAVWTLSPWFSTSAGSLAVTSDRAAAAQSFDEVVERCVRARDHSRTAALILIMPGHADAPHDLAYEWIRRLRSQLRPTDLAGRLTTGEVAVVAIETTPPGALVVARRIARLLNDPMDAVHKRVRVGLAAGDRASASADGLIAEARQHLVEA
jgi:hypothetical protein